VPVLLWLGLDVAAWVLAPLLSAPLAVGIVRAVRGSRDRSALHPVSPRMAGLAALHSALLAVGLALSR
jgi:1,4-dihydroxy-2-naphthoate octaprenyltransferase